ncbi:MAG: hypothetical protein ABII02_04545 [Candidatus Magasanikbacteria bacterium]
MKKLLIILGCLLFVLGSGVGTMYYFDICPPQGPWPTPPWCEKYEFVQPVYELEVETAYLEHIPAVNMSDTWGRNYNFAMLENTRKNIDSSFDRVQQLGAKEVYVHDFHRAVYDEEQNFKSLSYEIVDEIFSNDFRDESMTQKDLSALAKEAHKRNLKIGVKHNIAFVDIGKYIGLGDIEESVTADFEAFNKNHTKEWTEDYFNKWQARLLERAKMYEKAGIDIMSITPNWMGPRFPGEEALADTKRRELIAALREVFSGQIHLTIDDYGFIDGKNADEDWSKYTYFKDADIVEFDIYKLRDSFAVQKNPSIAQMRSGFSRYFDAIENKANKFGIKISVFFGPFSYPNAINDGIIEYHDIKKDSLASVEPDWQHQADAYQAFFEAMQGRDMFDRFIIAGYWWDDAMDPDVKVRISLSPSVRNKPAEEVIKQWLQVIK